MSGSKVRGPLALIDVRTDSTSEITEADVHGDADSPLQRAANVVSVPGYTLGHVGVDAAGDEEASSVAGVVIFGRKKKDEAGDAVRTKLA